MNRRSILAFALASLVAGRSFTQEKESALDPITITSSLSAQKTSGTGRNIIVIKGEKFTALPVHSVDELLRYIPGVEIQARGPMGAQSDIVIRGGTFQQVLVILDGVRLNDPNTGHFTSYIPIAPAEIERIEVLKGASSAIYGSEAVGGVIHIITKSFQAKKNLHRSEAGVQVTAGEYDLFSVRAGGFASNGKTAVSGGILSNNTKGQIQRGIRGYVNAHTASVSLSHYFSNNTQLAFRSAYDDRDFAAQNFYTNFLSDTSKERVKTLWNQLLLTHKGRKDQLSISLGYKTLNDHFAFNNISTANENKSGLFQALITEEWQAGTGTSMTSGLQFINKKISSNDRGDHSVKQSAAFAVLNQKLGSHFIMSPALRAEWNERAGWEIGPQLNLSYRTTLYQLRGSAGKTIRDADFTERFNNYNKVFVSSGRIGNPDLEAERSFSYEAGGDLFLSSLRLSATFFNRMHKKLIDYVPTLYSQMPRQVNLSPTGSYALAKNIAEVNTIGAETDVQYLKELQKGQQLFLAIGAVWTESKSSNTVPSFYISSHANRLLNFMFRYSGNRVAVSFSGLYKSRAPQSGAAGIAKVSSDYFVLNGKAEAFLIAKRLSAFIEADNIFNKKYADLLGAQMPGRWLMGGLNFSFLK